MYEIKKTFVIFDEISVTLWQNRLPYALFLCGRRRSVEDGQYGPRPTIYQPLVAPDSPPPDALWSVGDMLMAFVGWSNLEKYVWKS